MVILQYRSNDDYISEWMTERAGQQYPVSLVSLSFPVSLSLVSRSLSLVLGEMKMSSTNKLMVFPAVLCPFLRRSGHFYYKFLIINHIDPIIDSVLFHCVIALREYADPPLFLVFFSSLTN